AEFAPFDPHAWFTVYAPFDDPQIVLTILVEKAGEGSSVAGPVAREILDWYFR
ncbi:MAG TPA: penicillin-binding transpeptidase domain-containing protein, partial [Patescibacteria group bacterium]